MNIVEVTSTMMKLIWSMIIAGAALLAYPYLTKDPVYHPSFPEAAVDAVEYPQNVKILLLKPNQDRSSLQAYSYNTVVSREYNVPVGWTADFKPTLLRYTNSKRNEKVAPAEGEPDMVVRYVGRATTVDLVISSKTGSMWFLERGKVRPFYSRSFSAERKEVVATIRGAIPQTVAGNDR